MKRTKKYNLFVLFTFFVFAMSYFISNTYSVTVKKEVYLHSNKDIVTTRELAMLASLVYEDVPDERKYENILDINKGKACIKKDGTNNLGNCFFTADNKTLVKLTNSKYSAYQYIEGMSERKMSALVSKITASNKEDGQAYYFLNFADVKELEDDGWVIYDYKTTHDITKTNDEVNWLNDFDAITFKKGNNYVIAFRGTDFPDAAEWILSDGGYALSGENKQAYEAYNYAQKQYLKIIGENTNSSIYVTGHSLGAYLAQVGGAAIVDLEAGYCDSDIKNSTYCKNNEGPKNRNAKSYETLNAYNEDYKSYTNSPSKLKQVAYFNGMGVTAFLLAKNFNTNIDNALVYLSTHEINGDSSGAGYYVNYSKNINSSKRLVLYSIDNDPVSALGFHYGQIYKIDPAADAIYNHIGNHSIDLDVKDAAVNTVEEAFSNIDVKDAFDLSKKIYDIVAKTDNSSNEGASSVSTFVQNSLKDSENSKLINADYSYVSNLTSSLKKLVTGFADFSIKYGDLAIFDYANINHETDSFACLMDSEHGNITKDNINLRVTHENGSINLKADVTGGCADLYVYEYSLDGSNWIEKERTYKKEISFSDSGLSNASFRVKVGYGDHYKEVMVEPDILGVYKFKYTNVNSINNPTIEDPFMSYRDKTSGSTKENNYGTVWVTTSNEVKLSN